MADAINTPLYQKRAGELIQINPATTATQVTMADATTVEATLSALKTSVETFLTGDDDANGVLDRLKELVAAIEANKDSIDALLTDVLKQSDLVNDLTSGGTDKALTAEQGKALKALIDGLETGGVDLPNRADLEKLSVVDGQVAVEGTVMKSVMTVAALPETPPADLVEGGLLIVDETYTG